MPQRPDGGDPWWQSAVVYQVYPRSFADSPFARWADGGACYAATYGPPPFGRDVGDGVGDLEGLRSRLDHLEWLGVDAVWISPFYRSPMCDFGYDVSDHCDVDPIFGTLADADRLVEEAHRRGLRVLVDFVPNHTSDRHPWFVEARASRTSPRRDWYVWREGSPDRPPNNWRAAFTDAPAWTWDEPTGQWFLHLFLPEQPDLNWANPEVVEAMHSVARFWLDRGVDGFRVDVAHGLGKDPELPDHPPELAAVPHSSINDHDSTHPILRGLRRLVDGYPGDRVLLGEVYLLDTAKVARYYGDGDELHLAFNFPPLYSPWRAPEWHDHVRRAEAELGGRGAWPTWVLSNHDNARHRTRYGSEARGRAAAVLLLTLRGTPFLYAGEELGLEDAEVPQDRVVDPGGRDGCRAPIPWDANEGHGWSAPPWLPWPPDPATRNVETLRRDSGSILHLYRRLLAARRRSPALRLGSWAPLPAPAEVLAYERVRDEDRRAVVVNFGTGPVDVPLDGRWTVEVASDGRGESAPWRDHLGGDCAVLLRPG